VEAGFGGRLLNSWCTAEERSLGEHDDTTFAVDTGVMPISNFTSYAALGDSFGVHGDGELDWTARLRFILDGQSRLRDREPGEGAELVSYLVGWPASIQSSAAMRVVVDQVDETVRALRSAGLQVLLGNLIDPEFSPGLRTLRSRAADLNSHLWAIAREHRAFTLDVWGARELQATASWEHGRVILTASGHRLLASRAAHSLGVAYADTGGLATAASVTRSHR
jgi:hypothetical protein